MLAKGWIKLSVSPYGFHLLFIPKKTCKLRMCRNFHALNTNSKLDIFLLPHVINLLDKLGKPKYLSSIDLATAYL